MAETSLRRSEERADVVQLAQMRIGRRGDICPIKVRNLSSNGMMGEGSFQLHSGTRLTVELPEKGEVSGTVVWVQEPRFGVAFDQSTNPIFS